MPADVPKGLGSRSNSRIVLSVLAAVVCLAAFSSAAQKDSKKKTAQGQPPKTLGVQIVERGSYPELLVDGKPFFIHSAAFFYYRIPRDQWEYLLDRYQHSGINTIDIYIPWNWHEPKEGELDFDGHTNPRRDLRTLLKMIAERHLRLIARPGPEILNEWRNGGYPGWLLERPEYKMDSIDVLEGRYPPLDGLNAKDAEAAAEGWLANATHMQEARQWMTAAAKELAPYSSRRPWGKPGPKGEEPGGGPLLFVQLGDDFAIGRTNRVGPALWKYVGELRDAVEAAGVDVPVYLNPADMRVSAAGSALERPIGVMGQWYLRPPEGGGAAGTLTAADATEIEYLTEELETQPMFPPVMIEYQAGWYAPADDDHPARSPATNTLLSSRLMISNGLHGINYFPLQDTYTPAGYSVPWANRSYRWNAALSVDGEVRPEMAMVERNANLLGRWGPELAASHKRADFGIVDPIGAYPQELLTPEEIDDVSRRIQRMERTATLGMLSSELLDAEHQPLEQLMRDAAIFLPVFDPAKPEFQLSEKAQQALVDYVQGGGTLVLYLGRPAGRIIAELWKTAPHVPAEANESAIHSRWKFGQGEVIECTKDFDAWAALDRSFAENVSQPAAAYSIGLLRELVSAAGTAPAVRTLANERGLENVIATELVPDEGTGPLGKRTGRTGFLSVMNFGSGDAADVTLDALRPEASARSQGYNYVPVHVVVPAQESLVLPLNQPICFEDPVNAPCGDVVLESGAEVLDAKREDKTLEVLLYVPAKEDLTFHFAGQPSHVTLDDSKPGSEWTPQMNELHVSVPRGPAPSYLRLLKIDLPYEPHVPKLVKEGKPTPEELTLSVWNAVRLPVSENEFMRTYPPLIVAEPGKTASVVLSAFNLNTDYGRDMQVNVDGPLHGSEFYRMGPQGSEIERIKLKGPGGDSEGLPVAEDGLVHETMAVKAGSDRRVIPLTFIPLRAQGVTAYRYDFDRDGALEWVLENVALRTIVSPESGGRVIALTDKTDGEDLATSVGLMRDNFLFTPNPPGINPHRARGLYGVFNRTYAAKWGGDAKKPTISMQYDAPDVYPGGASIDKTIAIEDPAVVRADYRVKLAAAKAGTRETGTGEDHPQAFVAVNSFPASNEAGNATQFCWDETAKSNGDPAPVAIGGEQKKADNCVNFLPGGKALEVPKGVSKVEIRSQGQTTMDFEWDCAKECAQLRIEQKRFSALFWLQFPPLTPGGEAGTYTVRLRPIFQP